MTEWNIRLECYACARSSVTLARQALDGRRCAGAGGTLVHQKPTAPAGCTPGGLLVQALDAGTPRHRLTAPQPPRRRRAGAGDGTGSYPRRQAIPSKKRDALQNDKATDKA